MYNGNVNLKWLSENVAIYIAKVDAVVNPTKEPKNPEDTIKETAS